MKLYFMKQEALEQLKSNLPIVFNNYYTKKDNKWIYEVCEGDPFVFYKEIPDFELAPLDADLSYGEIDFRNCKILFENLRFLNESQACDERLWAGLCHSVFYDYLRKRWKYNAKSPKSPSSAANEIKSRFFFSGGIRAGLYRNVLSKLWWVGHNTYDGSKRNKFESLDILGSNDLSTKISDIFYSYSFSSNPQVLQGIIKGIDIIQSEGIVIAEREHLRPTVQYLNAVGGGVVLDCLEVDDIADIMVDHIHGIIQGDESTVELSHDIDELNNEDDTDTGLGEETMVDDFNATETDGFDMSKIDDFDLSEMDDFNVTEMDDFNVQEEELIVALGYRVDVVVPATGEALNNIFVDYMPGTELKLAALPKVLLGHKIGDEVEFNGKTYCISNIYLHEAK